MTSTNPLASPTPSGEYDMMSSISSLISLGSHHSSRASKDSDDEVVYSPDPSDQESSSSSASDFLSDYGSALESDDDFILLDIPKTSRQAQQAADDTQRVTSTFASLRLDHSDVHSQANPTPKPQARTRATILESPTTSINSQALPPRKSRKEKGKTPEVAPTTSLTVALNLHRSTSVTTLRGAVTRHAPLEASDTPSKRKKLSGAQRRKKKQQKLLEAEKHAALIPTGLGRRPVVDDISEISSIQGDDALSCTGRDEASQFISWFLQDPRRDPAAHLTFLQSLIVELGLAASSTLPTSLKSARSLIKSKAFVNICDYLRVRDQGPEAIQHVLLPSKTALIKSIKKNKRNRASKKDVKAKGLNALLVTCF